MEKGLIQSKVFFDDLTHSYINEEGKFLLGVTSLMKKYGLSPDYSNIKEGVLENAAKRGTEAHELLERYDNGEAVEDTPMIRAYKELNLNVLCSEYLVSDNEVVASKIDKVLADYSLADVKTTSKLHIQSLRWQLSIYAYLFEKQNPTIKVPALYAIHIQKSGKVKMEQINRIDNETIEKLIDMERGKGDIMLEWADLEEDTITPLSTALSKKSIDTLYKMELELSHLKDEIKAKEGKIKEYYATIYGFMDENNFKKMGNENFEYTFVAPYSKNVLDTTALKADYPDIAKEYTKETLVKGSIRVKFNKKN